MDGYKLTEMVDRVHLTGERIPLRDRGKTVAVLVPPSDLRALEALEDQLDLLDALDALADYRLNGGVGIEVLKANSCASAAAAVTCSAMD